MVKTDWDAAYVSPYMAKEDLLIRVKAGKSRYVNLQHEAEEPVFKQYFQDRGFDFTFVGDEEMPILKGRYAFQIVPIDLEGTLIPERIIERAGEDGELLEDLFDNWMETGKKPAEGLVEFHLSGLEKYSKDKRTYGHYLSIYDSLKRAHDNGWILE